MKEKKIRQFILETSKEKGFIGNILVSFRGELLIEESIGFANIEWGIENSTKTRFRIASITKLFTVALILQLVDEKLLTLDSVISDYLSFYRTDSGAKVKIHHMLSHCSGIPDHTIMPGFREKPVYQHFTQEQFATEYCSNDLEFEPGSSLKYSNSAFYLLGMIIEQVTGKSYGEVLREKILDPLQMLDSGYNPVDRVITGLATGYKVVADEWHITRCVDQSVIYAGGGMYSTVGDLYKFDRALYDETILPKELIDLMITAQYDIATYGWLFTDKPLFEGGPKLKVLSFSGNMPGFRTGFSRSIRDKVAVIILSNAEKTIIPYVGRGIYKIMYS